MFEIVNITNAKARLSELISRLIYKKDTIVITKNGKRVAVIIPFQKYQDLGKSQNRGLILAKQVLSSLNDEIEEMCDTIYRVREKEKSREVPL